MNIKSLQKGQALILITFAMVGLVAFGALTIDGGRVLSDKRHAQNAADTAAYAAALAKIQGGNSTAMTNAARTRALSNGYDDGTTLQDVVVNNPPTSGPYAGNSEYIQVIITSRVNTTFARVIGRNQVTNTVEAVARAQGSTSGGALFNGAGMVTLKPSGADTMLVNGNSTVRVIDSGIFNNSSSNCGMRLNGNINISVSTAYSVVGTLCQNGNITRTGPVQQGTAIAYPPNISIPEPNITCTGTGSKVGNTYYPGNWSQSLSFNGNGNITLSPGNYCLQNGAEISGNVNVTANDVNIKVTASQFRINGNSTFTCNNVIFFSTGSGSGFQFNGNGANNCTNVLFYVKTGNVTWNGNVANSFQAPTSGIYKGLLIFMPVTNNSPMTINGNSGNHIKGTIMALASEITINGNSGTETMDSQIIGYEMTVNGNSTTIIDYDGNENYSPPSSPTIELAK